MARLRAANNARTQLTQAVTDTDTILAVESTSLFPQPPFRITVDAEIMEVISVDPADNTFTVERAKEGTVASAHGVGASVENRFTAESYNELVSMQEFNEHLADIASQDVGKGADLIGLPDPDGNFTSTTVGGALQELFTSVSNGKNLIGGAITDVDPSIVIPPNPTFQDLADAIGQISTGMKIASGTIASATLNNNVDYVISLDLDFDPKQAVVFLPSSFGFDPSNVIRNPVLAKGDYINNSEPPTRLYVRHLVSPSPGVEFQITEYSSTVLKFKYFTTGGQSLPSVTVNNLAWFMVG